MKRLYERGMHIGKLNRDAEYIDGRVKMMGCSEER